MIERLLAAEGALERDELDHAQRLFGQVAEADPRNAIAVVGLARVLARRGDTEAARELVAHALDIDPDEAAAPRLLDELDRTTVAAPEPEPEAATPTPPGPAAVVEPASGSGGLLGWLRRLLRLD
jgi:thioredoxin-like negative regulator of GroEL